MKPVGLIFDFSPHYLDHLAPFCALLHWPLVICDASLSETARRFYPDLQILDCDPLDLKNFLNENFTHIVSCSPRTLLDSALGPISSTTLWLPHGHSDKGRIAPYFEALRDEKILLVYGQKMADFLRPHVKGRMVRVGQFRYEYYQKTRSFYNALPLAFSKKQRTILYAPTWEDAEKNSSFWTTFPILAKRLPESINLLVKPHPNTIAAHAPRIERLIGETERGNLQFLLDFPPIFPLLERCDAYLGDSSSIGYDFLRFDRPLFFIDPHPENPGDLLSCGQTVSPHDFFEHFMKEDALRYRKARRRMAAYTFDDVSLVDVGKSEWGQDENDAEIL
jgi:teichoic acid glycerol-phosphate primase